MKIYVVSFHGSGWVWSQPLYAESEQEASESAEALARLGQNVIVTSVREVDG